MAYRRTQRGRNKMNFIKLTLVSPHGNSGRDVLVNLDLVSEMRDCVTGSTMFYNVLNVDGEVEYVRVTQKPEFFNDHFRSAAKMVTER